MANFRPTNGEVLVKCRLLVGWQSTGSWPTCVCWSQSIVLQGIWYLAIISIQCIFYFWHHISLSTLSLNFPDQRPSGPASSENKKCFCSKSQWRIEPCTEIVKTPTNRRPHNLSWVGARLDPAAQSVHSSRDKGLPLWYYFSAEWLPLIRQQ